MINHKPNMLFHPFVNSWMKQYHLTLEDSCTEIGYLASPADLTSKQFILESPRQALDKLNDLYGTCFDKDFLEVKSIDVNKKFSLREITEESFHVNKLRKLSFESKKIQIERLKDILPPEEYNLELQSIECYNRSFIFIGGISVPNRSHLYVEYEFLDRFLKEPFSLREINPKICLGTGFIPINKKYLPKD